VSGYSNRLPITANDSGEGELAEQAGFTPLEAAIRNRHRGIDRSGNSPIFKKLGWGSWRYIGERDA
jgi:hypothetical protein